MTSADAKEQLFRLASDNASIYQDAWDWFLKQGSAVAPALVEGLEEEQLGSVAHWRILLVLRELALPSTLPEILKTLRRALERNDLIVLPGAMEAVAVFPVEQAVPALDLVLDSGEPDDVKHAVALLANLGNDEAVRSLRRLLDRDQTDIRKSTVQALAKINSELAREVLTRHREQEQDPDIRVLMNLILG